ncbi:MAG: hypothetical protein C0425_02660 [Chlorobiaceae bacterium]|nr:hypothetical protein [Chlorobiaceae bacterium]MBA4309223.1 hypothetical protein [Chlorobiaceae bacterium]
MKLIFTKENIIKGGLIYCIGDTIAALITNDFSISRMIGILLMGATIYAFEIPNYLAWLNNRNFGSSAKANIIRMVLFSLYFNPLWIARHLLLLNIFSGDFQKINWSLMSISLDSFIYSIPISLAGNYVIQNVIPFQHRFPSTAIFSGFMAIYYALSETLFG